MADLLPVIESIRNDEDRAHQRMLDCMQLFDKYLGLMKSGGVPSVPTDNNKEWIEVEPR